MADAAEYLINSLTLGKIILHLSLSFLFLKKKKTKKTKKEVKLKLYLSLGLEPTQTPQFSHRGHRPGFRT